MGRQYSLPLPLSLSLSLSLSGIEHLLKWEEVG